MCIYINIYIYNILKQTYISTLLSRKNRVEINSEGKNKKAK